MRLSRATGSGTIFAMIDHSGEILILTGPPGSGKTTAAATLAFVTAFQTAFMLIWMLMTDRSEIVQVVRSWRSSSLVGLAGVLGSACWFTAMTLQPVAYVRALGQIELIFTFLSSYFLFKERVTPLEMAGCLLIVAGIIGLLFH